MDRSLHALVVGTGYAGRQHVDALRQLRGVDIAATSTSAERAREGAAALAMPIFDDGFEPHLDWADVVHVCTRIDRHAPVAAAALEAGKHVICEKPLAADVASARELARLAAAAGRVAVLAHNYRFFPLVAEFAARVAGGALGTPHLVRGHFLQDRLLRERDTEDGGIGIARIVADLGSHWIDLAELIARARVESVIARATPHVPRAAASGDGQGALLFRLGEHLPATFVVSQIAAGHVNDLELSVDGADASATWRNERPDELSIASAGGVRTVVARDALASPHRDELAGWATGANASRRNFIRAAYAVIRGERKAASLPVPLPTFDDGVHLLEVAFAARESVRAGGWIELAPSAAR